jgi:hypothetical protein
MIVGGFKTPPLSFFSPPPFNKGKKSSVSFLSDTPFEFLTYQLDGRVVAYHGYNG